MLIQRLRIKNFRSIRSADIELGETTVLIGPNNVGKTAILDAVRIALTRRWGQRGTGFTEYDIHLLDESSDPKASPPVLIEVELREREEGEWSEDLQAELADIIQLDPVTGRGSILLRVSCGWDVTAGSYVPRWEFLNVNRAPLAGRGARAVNLQEFFQFVPVFYLDALRDADDEFSRQSQFWGRLLRTVQIPELLERRAQRVFDLLNRQLLAADPRLTNLATTLSEVSRVAAGDDPGHADLRMVPLRPWDLLSRAEVIYRCETDKPWLPLSRHGQGIQSLSVMFLFRAFIEQLLPDLYKPDSSPFLALEEPETHLHPQAARALWRHVSQLPGQKLVTTHSPYFLQHVPFRDLRIVRLEEGGTTISSLPAKFRATIPHTPELDRIVLQSDRRLSYDRGASELAAHCTLRQEDFRALLIAYTSRPDTAGVHALLKQLFDASQLFITDGELGQLETFARRIRGEIFFARRWLLVEGPSEYHLMQGIGKSLGYDLDEHGVAVIDFQNNGNPVCFVALARALRIPWMIVVDGDDAGRGYLAQLSRRGISNTDIEHRAIMLPAGTLEEQLVADGLEPDLKSVLIELGYADAGTFGKASLLTTLKDIKASYAAVLGQRAAADPALATRFPESLRRAITSLRGLT